MANLAEAGRKPPPRFHHHHHLQHQYGAMDDPASSPPPNGFPLSSQDPPSCRDSSRSNGDAGRPKSHSFHGDLGRPAPSSRLRWPCPLPFKRRFVIAFSVLVLLMLAFLIFSTVSVLPAFLLRHGEALPFPLLHFLRSRGLNQTLLALAKVDLGEQADRTQAENILDGAVSSRGTAYSKYAYIHDRFSHGEHDRDPIYQKAQTFHPEDQRLPLQLTSPRYRPYWAQFRSSLHSWVQRKRYDPQIMTQLLSSVKGPVDLHYMKSNHTAASGKPYGSCAVVGNSGILLNQEHGSLINGHDMVIRLNNARISGFEKHVGSKTTLSFINSNIFHSCARRIGCSCHPYGADVPLIMYICQVVHLMDVETCSPSLQAPVIVTDPSFDTLCARIVKYYSLKRFVEMTGRRLEDWSNAHEGPLFHYSSGMQAVLLAVGICEKVSIFGFGKSEKSKHHYHTGQKEELHLHDYGAEYELYMDLASQKAEIIPFLNEAGFVLPPVHIYW